MPRPPRLNPIDGIHHVTNHRAGDDDLFLTHRDFLLFLTLLQLASEETGVVVVEYCLMPNHYHLVVRCPTGSLDKFLHYLQGNYARAFNQRHEHKGPVFQRRYHNVVITTDEQFQLTCRYVNRNPAELGYDIAGYAWSSFALHKHAGTASHDVVQVEHTMLRTMFGSASAYVAFVEQPMTHDKFGLSGSRSVAIEQRSTIEDIGRLCSVIAHATNVDLATIHSSSRGRRNDARLMATLLANEFFPAEATQICSGLGYNNLATFRSALNRARAFAERNSHFATKLQLVRERWVETERQAA